jgi:esterase/lipase
VPSGAKGKTAWILAVHGYTSSKEEWLELGGYTHGGNLVRALVDLGYAVVAPDMEAHGDNAHPAEPVDYDDLVNDGWEGFFDRTVENLKAVIRATAKCELFDPDRCGFLSYSLGGLFGFWLANRRDLFKTMVMCVPPVLKNDDDQYAPYNNLKNLTRQSLLTIAAQQDEHIPFEASEWLYAQLPMTDKRFLSYPSGHSLPPDYVPQAVAWFKKRL